MRGSVHRRVERIVSCDPEAVRAEIMHGVLASFRRGEVGDLRANLTTVLREQDYTVQKLARYTMDLRRISPKRYRGLLKDARHTVSTSAEALSSETAKVVAGSSAALGSHRAAGLIPAPRSTSECSATSRWRASARRLDPTRIL